MQYKLFIILFLLLLYSSLSKGQDYIYTYERIDTKSGLSNGNVNHFFQDSRGLMWIATNDGLNMYDGINFVKYISQPNSNSITHNMVRKIAEDKDGNLWIATGNGLSFFNFETKKFKNFNKQSHQLSQNNLTFICIDQTEKIWLGNEKNIDVFDPKTKKLIRSFNLKKSLDGFFKDKDNNLYISNGFGIEKYDLKNNVFEQVFQVPKEYQRQNRGVCLDNRGYIWSSLEGKDSLTYLLKFNPKTKQYRVITDSSAKYTKDIGNRSVRFTKDKQGYIWKREGGYLSKINPTKPSIQKVHILEEIYEEYEKSSRIFLDKNDVFWLDLTGGGGLLLLPKWRINKIKYYKYDKHKPNSLTAKATRGIIKNQGKIWIGLYSNLDVFSTKGKKLHTIHNLPAYCFTLDTEKPDKFLWVGSEGKGLYKVNQHNYGYQQFLDKETLNIFSIAKDKETLYLASHKGLILFDTKTEKHQTFFYEKNKVFTYVLNSNKGFLWLGTREQGLLKFNLKTKKFTKVDINTKLSNFQIKSIYQDKKNILWIATSGNGFIKFNPKTKETRFWQEKDGLASNVVYGILEDEKNTLWMSTNKGICQFDPKTDKFRILNEHDRLQNNEFNTASFYKSKDGEMFFGGVNGLNSFYPKGLFNPFPAEIWLKKITSRHHEKHLHSSEEDFVLELSYEEARLFTLEFAALNYYHSHRNQYKYIIEEVYKDWKYMGNNPVINEHLTPGTYTFKIKASNNDGLWKEKGMTIKIIVYAPFWQKWWFLLLMLCLFSTLIYAIYRLRVRSLKTYQKELEATVALRTRELQDSNEEVILQRDQIVEKNKIVKSQKKELELKNQELLELNEEKNMLIGVVAHDLKSPLNQIKGLVYLISIYEQKLPEEVEQYMTLISDAVERLREMITRILDVNAIETKQLNMENKPVELVSLLSEVGKSFESQAEKKDIKLHYLNLESQFIINADSNYLRQVLENLISNAIKFSPQDKNIFLSVDIDQNKVLIKVRDEGPGISPSDQEKLFMKYHKLSAEPTAGEESTGLGLAIVKKFVEAMKGKIYCESELGKGSTFVLEFRGKN